MIGKEFANQRRVEVPRLRGAGVAAMRGEAAGRPVGSNSTVAVATTSTTSSSAPAGPLVYLAIILFVRDNCIG